eukprot:g352.t1
MSLRQVRKGSLRGGSLQREAGPSKVALGINRFGGSFLKKSKQLNPNLKYSTSFTTSPSSFSTNRPDSDSVALILVPEPTESRFKTRKQQRELENGAGICIPDKDVVPDAHSSPSQHFTTREGERTNSSQQSPDAITSTSFIRGSPLSDSSSPSSSISSVGLAKPAGQRPVWKPRTKNQVNSKRKENEQKKEKEQEKEKDGSYPWDKQTIELCSALSSEFATLHLSCPALVAPTTGFAVVLHCPGFVTLKQLLVTTAGRMPDASSIFSPLLKTALLAAGGDLLLALTPNPNSNKNNTQNDVPPSKAKQRVPSLVFVATTPGDLAIIFPASDNNIDTSSVSSALTQAPALAPSPVETEARGKAWRHRAEARRQTKISKPESNSKEATTSVISLGSRLAAFCTSRFLLHLRHALRQDLVEEERGHSMSQLEEFLDIGACSFETEAYAFSGPNQAYRFLQWCSLCKQASSSLACLSSQLEQQGGFRPNEKEKGPASMGSEDARDRHSLRGLLLRDHTDRVSVCNEALAGLCVTIQQQQQQQTSASILTWEELDMSFKYGVWLKTSSGKLGWEAKSFALPLSPVRNSSGYPDPVPNDQDKDKDKDKDTETEWLLHTITPSWIADPRTHAQLLGEVHVQDKDELLVLDRETEKENLMGENAPFTPSATADLVPVDVD